MKKTYRALDVDGTLSYCNVSFAFGKYLYSQGIISLWQALQATLLYALHKLGVLSLERLHGSIFRALFLGKKKVDIEKSADDFFLQMSESLFRKRLVEEVSDGLAKVVLLSSSPDFLIERVAQYVHADEWIATEYCTDGQGRFCSLARVVTGPFKAEIVRKERGQGYEVEAYSDSMLDLELLLEADRAVVVSPEKALARLADIKGWSVYE